MKNTHFSVTIDKIDHYERYSDPINPYDLSLEMTITRYQWFLERQEQYTRNEGIGLVVSDRENNNIMKKLGEHFEKFKHKGTKHAKIQNIIDTLFFAPSETCPMLQAADFCAYSIFSKHEHDKADRYKQIKPYFAPNGEYIHPNKQGGWAVARRQQDGSPSNGPQNHQLTICN